MLLMGSCFSSCEKRQKRSDDISPNYEVQKIKKAITISLNLEKKSETGFNVPDKYLNNYTLDFQNKSNESISVEKSFPRVYNDIVLRYKAYVYSNGVLKKVEQSFLVPKTTNKLNLSFKKEKYKFSESDWSIDSICTHYKELKKEILKNKNTISVKLKLDALYVDYSEKFIDSNSVMYRLNKMFYIEQLQMINPLNTDVDSFLKKLKNPIASRTLSAILYNYVKNRIGSFNYNKLGKQYVNSSYIELLALGHFSFLKNKKNIGKIKNNEAIKWLKTTDLYKKDSVFINKLIAPLNTSLFKEKIKKIKLLNTNNQEETLLEIIKENPSEYYLFDFWATWCAPCIKGIKTMKAMNIPKNVKIISISLDKQKDKQKWLVKTKQLAQPISYWLNEQSESGGHFLNFIELKSIPRYILIDKDMKLIDQAFYHPQESLFLSKLLDVRNSKQW